MRNLNTFITGILFIATFGFGQTNVSGNITANTTWTANGSPYNVTGDVGVPAGYTLTIESGVTVNYSGDYNILVKGNILINGSTSSHVVFNGNSSTGSEIMILFKSTDLSNSSINYTDFTGPQYAVRLAEESEHNQDETKNSDTLKVHYSSFNNTGVFTDGYSTTAGLIINNSTFSSCIIKGYYPRTEPIILKNCTIDTSIINSDSYNYGIKIYNSIVTRSNFSIGCCGSNFLIEESSIYKSPFSDYNNYYTVTINKSALVESPLYLPSGDVNIANSTIFFDGSKSFKDYNSASWSSYTTRDQQGVYTRQAIISYSTITGNGSGRGVEISSSSNYSSSISNSLIIDNSEGVKVTGNNGSYDFQNNNLINNTTYAINNQSNRSIIATNNYWGTTNSTEIENQIYHANDDLDLGTVSYSSYLSSLNTTAPISPPTAVTKVASGSNVVLTWTANPESDVAGYKVHHGTFTGYSYATTVDAGNVTTYTLSGVSIDSSISITAYDGNANGTDDQVEGYQSWFATAIIPPYSGPVWYVSTSGSDTNEGSQSEPFAKIQTAIDSSGNGDTVLVAAGTYTENINYNGKNIVVGSLYLTTSDTSYISSTIIDGNQNGSVVTFENSEDSTAVLSGFSLKNGNGSEVQVYQPNIVGGGILCNGSSPIISNCIITDNQADIGGGIGCIYSSNPIIKNVKIKNNNANYGNWGGGGIACLLGASPKIFDSVIDNNNAANGGGGLYSKGSNPEIINSLFSGNSAGKGGGLWAGGAPTVTNCTFTKNMVNSYEGNQTWGSSIYIDGNLNIINSNFWNNITQIMDMMEDTLISVTYNQHIVFEGNALSMNLNISFSNVQGGQEGIYFEGSNTSISWGSGNIDSDPLFVDAPNGDYRLSDYSPAIGAGTATGAPTTDIEGNIRPNPVGSTPDMGAYENALGTPVEHILVTNDSLVVLEDSSSTIDLLDNDLILNITSFTLVIVDSADNGTIALVGDSAMSYSPNANFFGNDTLSYRVFSSEATDTGLVFITVTPVNDPPEIVIPMNDMVVDEDNEPFLLGSLDFNDIDSDLTYSFTNDNTNLLSVNIEENNNVMLTLFADSSGTANLTFTADDGEYTVTDSVVVTINPVNDPPVANAFADTTDEDNSVNFELTGSDIEEVALTFVILDSTVHGTLAGVLPSLTYTPEAHYFGADSFTFIVNDGEYLDTAQVSLTVQAINDIPVANAQNTNTDEDTPIEIVLSGSDIENSDLVFSIVDSTVNGVLTGTLPELTYTPNENFNGSDSLTFIANDGELNSEPATVSITVNPVNDAPGIFLPDAFEFNEDDLLTVDFTPYFNDIDSDSSLILTVSDNVHIGVDIDTFLVTFTADTNWNGFEDIVFTIDDQNLRFTDSDTVRVTLLPVNDAPIITALDSVNIDEDSYAEVNLVGSDVDGDSLTFVATSTDTSVITIVSNDTLTLTPAVNWNGTADITVFVSDGFLSDTTSFVLTVTPVNDAPGITLPDTTINEGGVIEIILLADDIDGDELTYSSSSDTNAVIINVNEDTLLVSLIENWNGSSVITVVVTDENATSDTAEFILTVNPVNDSPEEFSVIYPTVSDTFSTHADNDSLIQFIWGKSNDVDSEVNYTLTIELEFFGNVYTDFYDDISDTTISISSNSLDPLLNVTAQDEAVFTFYVQASDEEYTVSDTGEFILSREALGIDDEVGIPEVFALHQNYPNPFNPTTTLRYDLPEQAHVEIMIYDIMGREVRSLVNNQQNAGFKSVLWDATNESGQPVSAGMYIYRISAGDFHSVKKMILLK